MVHTETDMVRDSDRHASGPDHDALDGLERVHDRVDARVVARERRPPAALRLEGRSFCNPFV
jgi:hypothetical protein